MILVYKAKTTHIRDCGSLLEDVNQPGVVFPVQNGTIWVLQQDETFYYRAQTCGNMYR